MSDTLRISGKRFGLPAVAPGWKFESRPGGWTIAVSPDGRRTRFALNEVRGKLTFAGGGRFGFGEIQKESRASASAGGSDADLTAQFPGKVRKLLVAAGANVASGAPLILVEAMKMEFTLKAPFAGCVRQILVTEGQQLAPGDRFFDFVALQGVEEGETRG